MSTPPALQVSGLKAYYQTNLFGVQRDVHAVDDVTLTIARNEIYGIAGESSSGKTSLIKTLAGAIRPPMRVVSGSVVYDFGGRAIDVYNGGLAALQAARWKHLSYIMQGSMSVLNPMRRIRESFRDFAFRHMAQSRREFRILVERHLSLLHLDPAILHSYPHELSGGMRQRVTIALATVCEPEFIIADEPTTALDVIVQKDVLALFQAVQRRIGSSVVFVTHDMSVHAAIADRVGIVYAGRLVEEGPTAAVFAAPRHPYTAHLIGSMPRIGDVSRKPSLPGAPPSLASPPSGCRFHPRCPLAIERCTLEAPALRADMPGRRTACFRADEVRPL